MRTQETATPLQNRLAAKIRSNGPNYKDWIFRMVIFVLILGSLGLSWWSVTQRLVPLQKRSGELSSAVAKVSAEVDELERKWSKAQAEQTQRRLDRAHDQLFRDQTALHSWLVNLRLEGTALSLPPKAEFEKAVLQPTEKWGETLAVIPATISVDFRAAPQGQQDQSPYQRLLRFTQRLSLNAKRADLTEVRVEAGTGSISSAVLLFGLWAVEGGAP